MQPTPSPTEIKSRALALRVIPAMIGVGLLTALFLLAADRYFEAWMPDGEILFIALGFLVLSRFFSQRERYLKRYAERAYDLAIWRFGVPGLGILFGAFAHLAYIAGPEIPALWWRPWLMGVGWFLVAAGVLLWFRALSSLGFATLMLRYVYEPQEGTQIRSGLYELIRHPIYSAAMHITFGLAFIHANWYALLVAVLIPIFFFGWVRLVEEKELIQRFPGYADYRRRVPAFLPWPQNEIKLWRILLGV